MLYVVGKDLDLYHKGSQLSLEIYCDKRLEGCCISRSEIADINQGHKWHDTNIQLIANVELRKFADQGIMINGKLRLVHGLIFVIKNQIYYKDLSQSFKF